MSTLIPIRQWNDLQKLTAAQIQFLKACEVYGGDDKKGENYLFTFIPKNPFDSVVADNVRTKAEYLGVKTNSIYPNRPEIELNTNPVLNTGDPYPNLTKARKARQEKHQKAVVTV